MKLQLDTTNKTIKIEENIKFSKLIETLKNMFPNNEWKDFTLETHTTINNWNYPIIYKTYPQWWEQPWYCNTVNTEYKSNLNTAEYKATTNGVGITNGESIKSAYQLKGGVFNVEM
jgi:hypothetical protein